MFKYFPNDFLRNHFVETYFKISAINEIMLKSIEIVRYKYSFV